MRIQKDEQTDEQIDKQKDSKISFFRLPTLLLFYLCIDTVKRTMKQELLLNIRHPVYLPFYSLVLFIYTREYL